MRDAGLVFLHIVLPVTLGGISNMVFVKAPLLDGLRRPIDAGRRAADGRRLLGDNKTWKGLAGMVALTALWSGLVDLAIEHLGGAWPRAPFAPAVLGALLGLAYALAELPNSYLKRRLDIAPGTNGSGWLGRAFIVVDQTDSVLGCLLVALLLTPLGWTEAGVIVVLCAALHLGVNRMLFHLRLKGQKY
jgi:CDP-diglyceride synthetase